MGGCRSRAGNCLDRPTALRAGAAVAASVATIAVMDTSPSSISSLDSANLCAASSGLAPIPLSAALAPRLPWPATATRIGAGAARALAPPSFAFFFTGVGHAGLLDPPLGPPRPSAGVATVVALPTAPFSFRASTASPFAFRSRGRRATAPLGAVAPAARVFVLETVVRFGIGLVLALVVVSDALIASILTAFGARPCSRDPSLGLSRELCRFCCSLGLLRDRDLLRPRRCRLGDRRRGRLGPSLREGELRSRLRDLARQSRSLSDRSRSSRPLLRGTLSPSRSAFLVGDRSDRRPSLLRDRSRPPARGPTRDPRSTRLGSISRRVSPPRCSLLVGRLRPRRGERSALSRCLRAGRDNAISSKLP